MNSQLSFTCPTMTANAKNHAPAAIPSLDAQETLSGWDAALAMMIVSAILLLVMTA